MYPKLMPFYATLNEKSVNLFSEYLSVFCECFKKNLYQKINKMQK